MQSSLSILIVDDDVNVLGCVAESLERVGHVCFQAPSADQALFIASRQLIQVSILDMFIRGRTGLETFAQLRSMYRSLAAILMSGNLTMEIRDEARRLGIRSVLSKPLDLTDLRETLEAIAV